jgi:LacI family transcriptional regulator
MKTDISHIIGLLVPNMGEFHAELLEQISRKFRSTGRAVMSYSHAMDGRSVMEGIESFLSHRVDAIIMAGVPHLDEPLKRLVRRGLSIVLYDNDIPGLPADRVFVNNREASRHAVEHLIELGHTRIATIAGRQEDSVGRDRLYGYYDALDAHGIERDARLVQTCDWRDISGYAAISSFYAQKSAPTAIFSANYNMTIGALTWIHEQGMGIPEDISLVSFDDVPAFRVHMPGITAVGQPSEALADNIAAILAARLEKRGAIPHRTVTIKCGLTLRGSTRRHRPKEREQAREAR